MKNLYKALGLYKFICLLYYNLTFRRPDTITTASTITFATWVLFPHEFLPRKEGVHFPSRTVLITRIKTPFFPVVFLSSYNVCDVVFHIICHDVLLPVRIQCSRLMSNNRRYLLTCYTYNLLVRLPSCYTTVENVFTRMHEWDPLSPSISRERLELETSNVASSKMQN